MEQAAFSPEITKRHQEAIEAGEDFYVDPDSGLWVATVLILKRRGYCCGSGCRHCPYPEAEQRLAQKNINIRPQA